MLSKETGILFVAMALLYTFISDKKRLYPLLGLSAIITIVYLYLKIHATGLIGSHLNLAPIDNLSLGQRLLNAPSIVLFYLTKFTFPIGLAHGYYWAYKTLTFRGVTLPAIVIIVLSSLVIYYAYSLYRRGLHRELILVVFFTVWLLLGLLMHIQIIPLDNTASEAWFYFPMVGLLGMIGVWVDTLQWRMPSWLGIGAVVLVVAIFCVRTAVRGTNWGSVMTLASNDIKVSKEDYISEYMLSSALVNQGDLSEAMVHAERSINMFPSASGYNYLGIVSGQMHNYGDARQAFQTGLKYQRLNALYENAAHTYVWDPNADTEGMALIHQGLHKYPRDFKLWLYLALLGYHKGDTPTAKTAIAQASRYGQVDPLVYTTIIGSK